MKKKIYQAPTMTVVITRHRSSLLAGSPTVSGLQNFGGSQGYYDDDDEAD